DQRRGRGGRIRAGECLMNTAARLSLYGAGLAVVFAAALGAGSAAGPAPSAAGQGATGQKTTGHTTEADHEAHTPGGLQVSENGYTFTRIATDDPDDFRFEITDPDGDPVTAYDVEHDKKLHLIVASRDLTAFHHLHPELADERTW